MNRKTRRAVSTKVKRLRRQKKRAELREKKKVEAAAKAVARYLWEHPELLSEQEPEPPV